MRTITEFELDKLYGDKSVKSADNSTTNTMVVDTVEGKNKANEPIDITFIRVYGNEKDGYVYNKQGHKGMETHYLESWSSVELKGKMEGVLFNTGSGKTTYK